VAGMSVSESDNFLAVALGGGLLYAVNNRVAVGAYAEYKPWIEGALNDFFDAGLLLSYAK
jgi:hypothetical protein